MNSIDSPTEEPIARSGCAQLTNAAMPLFPTSGARARFWPCWFRWLIFPRARDEPVFDMCCITRWSA